MPQSSDEVLFIASILGVAIFILVVLLVTVVLIRFYGQQRTDKFTSNPLSKPGHSVELESVEVAKIESVPKGIKARDWQGCGAMVFVLIASGIVIVWLLRPYLVSLLYYFGICCQ